MSKAAEHHFDADDFSPPFRNTLLAAGLNPSRLTVVVQRGNDHRIEIPNRQKVLLSDGIRVAEWNVPSLRVLCRGTKAPPAEMNKYPDEYVPAFWFLEKHLLDAFKCGGELTDRELEDIYAALRRRPDGRSLGPVHDYLWQVSAALLGLLPLSQAEFEAVVNRLERSCRTWHHGLASRNYIAFLRNSF